MTTTASVARAGEGFYIVDVSKPSRLYTIKREGRVWWLSGRRSDGRFIQDDCPTKAAAIQSAIRYYDADLTDGGPR